MGSLNPFICFIEAQGLFRIFVLIKFQWQLKVILKLVAATIAENRQIYHSFGGFQEFVHDIHCIV